MLELDILRDKREEVIAGLKKRGVGNDILEGVDNLVVLDEKRKTLQKQMDDQLAQINKISREIGSLFGRAKAGDEDAREKAEEAKKKVTDFKALVSKVESEHLEVKAKISELLYEIPNVPHHSVPAGAGEDDNEVYQDAAEALPELGEGAKPHWELGEEYELFNFEWGTKLAGSGFPVYTGKGAALERALISFFLSEATLAGYLEVMPPLMVNEDTARGTGQLPDKEAQMYHVEKDNFYLIPTAEVPITNIYRDVIVSEEDLPIKLTGYTPCFRREAGSYGADVKGLNRVHQFDKVEIVQLSHPDESYEQLNGMLKQVEGLLIKLGLPYRILRLCGGDMGFTSALTFDFEVYSPAQKRWLEVSSVSNFETFQSNRMKIRYKSGKGKPTLVHTLNGSALALPRIMAALLEMNQTENGITIPEVLVPFTGFDIIRKN